VLQLVGEMTGGNQMASTKKITTKAKGKVTPAAKKASSKVSAVKTKSTTSTAKKPVVAKKAATAKKPVVAKKTATTKKTTTSKKPVAVKKATTVKKSVPIKKAPAAKKSVVAKKTSATKKVVASKKVTAAKKPVATKKASSKVSAVKPATKKIIAEKKVAPAKKISLGKKTVASPKPIAVKKAETAKKPAPIAKASPQKVETKKSTTTPKINTPVVPIKNKSSTPAKKSVKINVTNSALSAMSAQGSTSVAPVVKQKMPTLNKITEETMDELSDITIPTATESSLPTKTHHIIAGAEGIEPYKPVAGEEYMSEGQIKHFRVILDSMRRQLMEDVDRTVNNMRDSDKNLSDFTDRATNEEEMFFMLRTRGREGKLLKKIEEALERLEHHDYGYCDGCGVEIGIRRLEARPTATLCIDCKTLDEIREKQRGS
jgi:DnaK suppressor protein